MDDRMEKLQAWVNEKAANGITQHSTEWLNNKVFTIGGSSIATIIGINPYSNINKLISEKIGLTNYENNVKIQWGNLFEEIIKRYVEHDKQCTILGEDLYITTDGPAAYSPDGLTVLNLDYSEAHELITSPGPKVAYNKPTITLVEFKCPYSRIPTGRIPKYYIPQVLMGMDVLQLPTAALFVEGVFRRCAIKDWGFNSRYDKTIVPRTPVAIPSAIGMIGFYSAETIIEPTNISCCDLGELDQASFEKLMTAYSSGAAIPYYMPLIYQGLTKVIDADVIIKSFMELCISRNSQCIGVLPWKLARIDYNLIGKEQNYITRWMPKIIEVIDVVKKCLSNESTKLNTYNEYIYNMNAGCFSDE